LPIIAIDYTPAYGQGGGIGRYVRALVAALARQDQNSAYKLFVAGATRSVLPSPPGSNFVWRTTRLSPRWLARIWHRARLPIPIETFLGAADFVHATDFVLPPTRPGTRTLLTIHDLSFVRVPEAASPGLKAYLDRVVPSSVRRADHILADSQATKDDLIALYKTPHEKITVLLSGVDPVFRRTDQLSITAIRSRYNLQRPFIFSVGTVQPRKNYSRLIQALSQLLQKGYELDLVIAGGRGWLEDPIYRTVQVTHTQEHVHFVGFVDETDLPAFYSAAECLAFPSLYEGFGLPILEAMACGTPVITSNSSSLPEVAGDAALIVDPYSTEVIADAIQRLLDDTALRNTLVEKGYQRVGQFSWDESARKLRQIYANML
jgi:glycosyltransferase involved in cell wall biosynthesis